MNDHYYLSIREHFPDQIQWLDIDLTDWISGQNPAQPLREIDQLTDRGNPISFGYEHRQPNGKQIVQTALTLEYDETYFDQVIRSISDLEDLMVILIPTHRNGFPTFLTVWPIPESVNGKIARRAAQLIAQYIQSPGLIENSQDGSMAFYPRSDLPIHVRDGTLVNPSKMIQDALGITTTTAQFYRPKSRNQNNS